MHFFDGIDKSNVVPNLKPTSKNANYVSAVSTANKLLDISFDGEFKGHIFPDFIEAVKRFSAQNLRIYSFSSGSVDAQKLLFSHSDGGDLTEMFNGHFDTRTGNKLDKQAYCNILNTISLSPKQVLFVSDVIEELKAADAAGMMTCQMVRDSKPRTGDFRTISSFDELVIE